jgi:YVTN family beta-propeller protein
LSGDGSRAVVVCRESSDLAIVELASGSVTNIPHPVYKGEHPVRAVRVGTEMLLMNLYSLFATRIDPVAGTVVGHHSVPAYCTDALADTVRGEIYVANKYLDQVLVYDLAMQAVQVDPGIPVGRNPASMALGADGRLYVANMASWDVSVIDLDTRTVVETIFLGSGATSLLAFGTDILATNVGGASLARIHEAPLIDNDQNEIVNQVTWISTTDWSTQSTWIDLAADYQDLQAGHGLLVFCGSGDGTVLIHRVSDPIDEVQRIDLLADGSGLPGGRTPAGLRIYTNTRCVAIADSTTVYAANYDRDTMVKLTYDAAGDSFRVDGEISLNPAGVPITALQPTGVNMTHRQNGERYLNTIASWKRNQADFTCSTCHPDAHTDYRFLADHGQDPHNPPAEQGPEHHPSLLGVSLSRPYAWEGNSPTLADFNLRALDSHDIPPKNGDVHLDIAMTFLPVFEGALRADPSPYEQPNFDPIEPNAPERGFLVFFGAGACAGCHSNAELTDHQLHNVGTGRLLDTPHLMGTWDRAPYLHDGRAATLLDVLDAALYEPPGGAVVPHGNLTSLTEQQKSDLVAYLLSVSFQGLAITDAPAAFPAGGGSVLRLVTAPNPFSESVRIDFDVLRRAHGKLSVVDLQGRRVRTLLDAPLEEGAARLWWDGRDDRGRKLPAGAYWVRLGTAAGEAAVKILRID